MYPIKANLVSTVSGFSKDDWNTLFDWGNRKYSAPRTTLLNVNIQELLDQFLVEMALASFR